MPTCRRGEGYMECARYIQASVAELPDQEMHAGAIKHMFGAYDMKFGRYDTR
jgi:hypothetical protein